MNNSSGCQMEKELFDIAIIAAPQTVDNNPIDIRGFDEEMIRPKFSFPGKYHLTVATLVHGDLNPKYVGCSNIECTTEAYFFVDPNHNINSIAKLVMQYNFHPLYK